MSQTLASEINFAELCNTLELIKKAPSSKKDDILQRYIQNIRKRGEGLKEKNPAADISLYPLLRLLLPDLERERGPHNLKQKLLAHLYIRVFCLGKGSRDANQLMNYKTPTSSKAIGTDFAETAYLILRNRCSVNNPSYAIKDINLFLDEISERNKTSQQKDGVFNVLLKNITALEFKWVTRIILKDLRLGMGKMRILRAYHRDACDFFDVISDLRQLCEKLHDPKVKFDYGVQIFNCIKPMLLEKWKIEDADKLFQHNEEYFLQWKFDGERSQIHMKNGVFKYFTRMGFDITNNTSYGETASSSGILTRKIASLLNPNCHSVILDGELMGWHKERQMFSTKGVGFDVKKLTSNSHHQPCFVAFDILMYNDELLFSKPYSDRLTILQEVFTEEKGYLFKCETKRISSSHEVEDMFKQCLERSEEGIVLKKCDVTYKPNIREGSGCYKIKAEFSDNLVEDFDLLILGGYYGSGKHTGTIKSFMTGVACEPDVKGANPSKFLCVVSVSNGFTFEQLKSLQQKFNSYWTKECPKNVIGPKSEPPDLWICPENSVVVTVRASEMIRTTSYPTGYTLRFPRVTSVRDDKPWYNTCTTRELTSLVKDKNVVQKLTKRPVSNDMLDTPRVVKARRIPISILSKMDQKSVSSEVSNDRIVPLSRLLHGKEICVINGNNELSKEQVENILHQHRAKVVQNPARQTFCVIIGNPETFKAKHIIGSQKYDVVGIDWLKYVTKEENWSLLQDFLPWNLISSRELTRHRLDRKYDKFYDSFTIDADEESLARSLEKAEESVKNLVFTADEEIEMDQELFGRYSLFSLFREIIGYFDDSTDTMEYKFRFMGGTKKEDFDESVTHIFAMKDSCTLLEKYQSNTTQKIVRSKWINDCFQNQKLIPIDEYVIV